MERPCTEEIICQNEKKKKTVANSNYYKSRNNGNPSGPSWLLLALSVIIGLVGIGGLSNNDYSDYPVAIGAIFFCLFFAVLFVVSVMNIRNTDRAVRCSELPLWLLMVLVALLGLEGIVGLINGNLSGAFGYICICIVFAVVFATCFKMVRNNNKVFEGLTAYKRNILEARRSETVTGFISNYDRAIEGVAVVASVEPEFLIDGMLAEGKLIELRNEFQKNIEQVIKQEQDYVLCDLNYKYKHSLKHKEAVYHDFWHDIEINKNRFSSVTKLCADLAVESVYRASGSVEKVHYPLSSQKATQTLIANPTNDGIGLDIDCYAKNTEEIFGEISIQKDTGSEIEIIDKMSGLEFEKWCADVLRKNAFTSVRVTPGSNDQGVDILAEKDGVKYAIQCKCYTRDLDNTPIQEVLAGKKYYDCHVGVVMTNRHFTRGAVVLAKKTAVLLWDRETVTKMASN